MKTKNVKVTQTFQERLKAFQAIQPETKHYYIPAIYLEKDDKGIPLVPKNQRARFTIEAYNALHVAEIQDQFTAGTFNPGAQVLKIVKEHIKGWDNWTVPWNESLYLKDDELTDQALKLFKGPLMEELFMAITQGNELSEDEYRALE